MFEAERALDYLAAMTRTKINASNSFGIIIFLAILIIWVSQIYPNIKTIETFVKFNSYLLKVNKSVSQDLASPTLKASQRKKKTNELNSQTDTAATKLANLQLDFELPGFPKLSKIGLQFSIVIWLTMFFLIFQYFYESRKSFYLYNMKALMIYSKQLANKRLPIMDFDIVFPFWVMPLPKGKLLSAKIPVSEYKTAYSISDENKKNILLIVVLLTATAFFFYNIVISLRLFYSQIYYLELKRQPSIKSIVVLWFLVASCFALAFFWLTQLTRWIISGLTFKFQ